jgi:methylamine---glutamate N-methyltransferase subunit A
MCGIVGLLLKDPSWDDRLGELLVPMLVGMTDRGPDSAGLAVFATTPTTATKLSLFQLHGVVDWATFMRALARDLPGEHGLHESGRHAVLSTRADISAVRQHIAHIPGLVILSQGHQIDLYKDIGTPGAIAERYGFVKLTGSHAVGHTRMATESAVTPAHAHPFTAGEDFCLVHNGSLSNPNLVRRKLEPLGIHFETDNDTEAACRFLEWRMREGDSIEKAINQGFTELDGFFTFLIGTQDGLSLVRDPFACKPAIVAETEHYVAVASEFRSLAHLPGVASAKLFEPQPRTIYSWKRA